MGSAVASPGTHSSRPRFDPGPVGGAEHGGWVVQTVVQTFWLVFFIIRKETNASVQNNMFHSGNITQSNVALDSNCMQPWESSLHNHPAQPPTAPTKQGTKPRRPSIDGDGDHL